MCWSAARSISIGFSKSNLSFWKMVAMTTIMMMIMITMAMTTITITVILTAA